MLWGVAISPHFWWSFRFRNSAMVGLTPQQIMERCGEPDYASSRSYEESTGGTSSPYWRRFDEATRRELLATKDLLFGYRGWMGDQFSVYFEKGVVNRVVASSK